MFGGLAFMLGDHIGVTANRHGRMMARVDPAEAPALIAPPLVQPMMMAGRERNGWLDVDITEMPDAEVEE